MLFTLAVLRNAGITEGEIAELARFVDVWGKRWQYGNDSGGNTNMNGSISSSAGKVNELNLSWTIN